MAEKTIEVLIVEDNEVDVRLAKQALRAWGEQIHFARDGEEAIRFLAECEAAMSSKHGSMPKLILLDLQLPGMDGHELLRQVRNNPLTRWIPVVVLTSSRQDDDLNKAYAYGANSYIQKPMSFREFRRSLTDLFSYWIGSNCLRSSAPPAGNKAG